MESNRSTPIAGMSSSKRRGSLRSRLMLAFTLSTVIAFSLAAILSALLIRNIASKSANRNAEVLAHVVADGVQTFGQIGDMNGLSLFLENIEKHKLLQDLHVARGSVVAKEFKEREGATPRDPVESEVMEQGETKVLPDSSGHSIRFVLPSLAQESCLTCHNVPKDSVLGITSVTVSTAESDQALASLNKALWAGFFGMVTLALVCSFLLSKMIVQPLRDVIALLSVIAEGDFSTEVPVKFRQRGDEMGDLARAFYTMMNNTRELLKSLMKGVDTVALSAIELTKVSGDSAQSLTTMSSNTSAVATASEEARENTTSVAASMEQAAANLSSVASATEEMSATIGEIASNSERARAITEQASERGSEISGLMQRLGQSAQEIGKVTETINDISSQTNLLALNATIEAARAGAAGKGFAVVANEIKELARQTASATEDIKARIAGVQNSTGSAITDIGQITAVFGDIGHIVTSIASAIDQQAAVTRDVAGNIAHASEGVHDSSERVTQTANVSRTIAEELAGISSAVQDMRKGGELVRARATELSRLSEQLKEAVSHFKI